MQINTIGMGTSETLAPAGEKFYIKRIFLVLMFSLGTKCPQEPINLTIINNYERNIIFSTIKLKQIDIKMVLKNKDDGEGYYVFTKINKHKKEKIFKGKSILDICLSKNEQFYVFYFYKLNKSNTSFYGKYDSIIVSKNKIKIGEWGRNFFIYSKDKIIFKSNDLKNN